MQQQLCMQLQQQPGTRLQPEQQQLESMGQQQQETVLLLDWVA